jgi:hypothetical protein
MREKSIFFSLQNVVWRLELVWFSEEIKPMHLAKLLDTYNHYYYLQVFLKEINFHYKAYKTVLLFREQCKCLHFTLQYLACLSTSSSNDKLAFDVGLQEHSQGVYL